MDLAESELPQPILTKRQMYYLLDRGLLGNAVRTWPTLQEALDSDCPEFSCRSRLSSSGFTRPQSMYHIPREKLRESLQPLTAEQRASLVFCEPPPDDHRVFQGELMRSWRGLELTYSFVQLPMKAAFAAEPPTASRNTLCGLSAVVFLRANMPVESIELLTELVDHYDVLGPTANSPVVEFTLFRVRCGRDREKLLIWEVRSY